MKADIHIVFTTRRVWLSVDDFIVHAIAQKTMIPPTDTLTPKNRCFLYSQKAKRYIVADLYFQDWRGSQSLAPIPDSKELRRALLKIGMDLR